MGALDSNLFCVKSEDIEKKVVNPNSYYDITNLLTKTDINGNLPEIFVVCGNRSSGKTTSANRVVIDGWMQGYLKEVMFIRRYVNEVPGTASNIFNLDFVEGFFPNNPELKKVKEQKFLDGAVSKITIDGKNFGWVVALNAADKIKKNSSMFYNVDMMVFDEFMPETGEYCSNEVEKLKSIHVSVARKYGYRSRFVPVIMMSNLVSLINPYFLAWGFASRLNLNTRFLKGTGIVMEQNFNRGASTEHSQSAFLQAFGNNDYYTDAFAYLNDDFAFVGKIKEKTKYMATLIYDGKRYGLKIAEERGLVYVDRKPDIQFKLCVVNSPKDYQEGYFLKSDLPELIDGLKRLFERGKFRFENQEVKDMVFNFILK